ncbi:hypothetical protein ACG7TL_006167 [Trametes sanguinea]
MPELLDIAPRPIPRYLANRHMEKTILLLVLWMAWNILSFVRDYEELRRSGGVSDSVMSPKALKAPDEAAICVAARGVETPEEGQLLDSLGDCAALSTPLKVVSGNQETCFVFRNADSARSFATCVVERRGYHAAVYILPPSSTP